MDEVLKNDENYRRVAGAVTNDSDLDVKMLRVDPTSLRVLTDATITDGFDIGEYDYISLSYTGSNLTGVVYKTGGSGGTTVATLTLGYDGSDNLTSVTKT